MNSPAITETVALIAKIGAALSSAATPSDDNAAADLRLALGNLVDRAEMNIRGQGMGSALQTAFAAALAAEAGFDGMDRVRALAVGATMVTKSGLAAQTACVRFALIGIAAALAETTFRSREDAQAAGARVNAAFSPAIDQAADAGDTAAFRDMVALHAAVTRDLAQRARPLPRIVTYRFARRMPTLIVSQKLYGAGDRADEIAAENKVIHPLFAPAQGKALSV